MKEIIFINSHPIQYFAPLYKYLNEKGIVTKAWYCTDISIRGMQDKEFGVNVKWDIDLLDGYDYRFFKNNSWKPSHFNGFFGLINISLLVNLFKIPKSVIIVHGWHYFTHFMVILIAGLRGHTVCLRVETPNNQEVLKQGFKYKVKRFFLRNVLFRIPKYFLYIGSQNKAFYLNLGVKETKLVFCPYAVDNRRFKSEFAALKNEKDSIKQRLNIPVSDKVILYSGKFMDKKRPVDLLKAYMKTKHENVWLVMIGEGALRGEMEAIIAENKLEKVILTGFINQSKISEYYSVGDVFVMCSTIGETWGLSVNEAMNFNLPVIVSDLTGSSSDLVVEGVNGYTFKMGDIDGLARQIDKVVSENALSAPESSEQIIEGYSYKTIADNVSKIL